MKNMIGPRNGISGRLVLGSLASLASLTLVLLFSAPSASAQTYPILKESSATTCAEEKPGSFYHTVLMQCQECENTKEILATDGKWNLG